MNTKKSIHIIGVTSFILLAATIQIGYVIKPRAKPSEIE